MQLELKLNKRLAKAELIKKQGNIYHIKVDNTVYEVDVIETSPGIYSILHNGHSQNVELIEAGNPKKYNVNTLYKKFDIEVVDAESRYIEARKKQSGLSESNVVSSPMPGRVVKIPVNKGDDVTEGQTVIVISAMKMESEYKAPKTGKIKDIKVKEGDIITGGQALVILD